MNGGVEMFSPLEAAEAVRFVFPRLSDEEYVFPPPDGAGADEEFNAYE